MKANVGWLCGKKKAESEKLLKESRKSIDSLKAMTKQPFFLPAMAFLTFVSFMLSEPFSRDYNYITSGYYQLIYEADMAYLSGDSALAYAKIQQAKERCPLIEQSAYYEMERYVELSVQYQKYEEALTYLKQLVREYGYPVEWFEKQAYFPLLEQHVDWQAIRPNLENESNCFYTSTKTKIVDELRNMAFIDQKIREENKIQPIQLIKNQLDNVDSINAVKMKCIFEQYGYPNMHLLGYKNAIMDMTQDPPSPPVLISVKTMLMHFSDTTYFKPVLLKFVEQGECQPNILGAFVDSYARQDTAQLKYLYGIYSNAYDKIKDKENLDNRRKAIGLPPLKMQQQLDSLLRIKYQ